MNKRILTLVLVLVLMLSMATSTFAASTETYFLPSDLLVGSPIKVTIPNVTETKRVVMGTEEISEYLSDLTYLDKTTFSVLDPVEDGVYDEFTEYTRSPMTLGQLIERENLLGGVTVYTVEGPVELAVEDAMRSFMFSWLDENIQTTYVAKYFDYLEYIEIYDNVRSIEGLQIYNDAPEYWLLAPGTKAGLTEAGKYLFYMGNANGTDAGIFAVHVKATQTPAPAPEVPATRITATPTASTVLVNNTSTEFEAYTIEGNNYFKLRDLAQVLSDTPKPFEVEWDGAKNAINLISNKAYTPAGGELAKGDNKVKEAKPTTSVIYKDGVELSLTAYTIGGNNFFKLRDIAEAFDIGVTWDNATKTIGIDTSVGYIAE